MQDGNTAGTFEEVNLDNTAKNFGEINFGYILILKQFSSKFIKKLLLVCCSWKLKGECKNCVKSGNPAGTSKEVIFYYIPALKFVKLL